MGHKHGCMVTVFDYNTVFQVKQHFSRAIFSGLETLKAGENACVLADFREYFNGISFIFLRHPRDRKAACRRLLATH